MANSHDDINPALQNRTAEQIAVVAPGSGERIALSESALGEQSQ